MNPLRVRMAQEIASGLYGRRRGHALQELGDAKTQELITICDGLVELVKRDLSGNTVEPVGADDMRDGARVHEYLRPGESLESLYEQAPTPPQFDTDPDACPI